MKSALEIARDAVNKLEHCTAHKRILAHAVIEQHEALSKAGKIMSFLVGPTRSGREPCYEAADEWLTKYGPQLNLGE